MNQGSSNSTATYDSDQLAAIELCTQHNKRLGVINGSAGVGKTTIFREAFALLEPNGYEVAAVAPTGKAAKRIQEATGIPAKTIHRYLEYSHPGQPDPETGEVARVSAPKRTAEKPVTADFIFVDEAAMIAPELYRALIDAMKPGSAIRFFGDVNQLGPIEDRSSNVQPKQPSPFQRLIRCGDFPVITLHKIYRQGPGSAIVSNGSRIISGSIPLHDNNDFQLITSDNPIGTLCSAMRRKFAAGDMGFAAPSHQIITPQRVGKAGSIALNAILTDVFEDGQQRISVPRHPKDAKKTGIWSINIAVGQKVICNQNMYDLRPTMEERYRDSDLKSSYIPPTPEQMIYNGESGVVVSVDGDYIAIDVGDRVVSIPDQLEYFKEDGSIAHIDPRRDIEHGYAITTHKAQGSEYEGVIYLITSANQWNQDRHNYYTAVTRAKKQAAVIGDRASIQHYSLRKEVPSWK